MSLRVRARGQRYRPMPPGNSTPGDAVHVLLGATKIIGVLFTLRLVQIVLSAAWNRRWQLSNAVLGGSPYELLSRAYEAESIGIQQVEAEEHDHDHGHGHGGPREVVIVDQRWAVVTGGSRGIGRAFVRLLSDQGFSLIILDSDEEELQSTALKARQRLERGWHGGVWRRTREAPTVTVITCDAAHVDVCVRKVEEAIGAVPAGGLRLLVNNVGQSTLAPALLTHHSAAEITRLVHTNALFAMQLTRALWTRLVAPPEGRRAGVLFVAARAAYQPAPLASVYAATKSALAAFACALRAEATGLGLRLDVLCVTPGRVRAGVTPRWVGTPAGLAEPDDVARAALLLLETAGNATLAPLLREALADAISRHMPETALARRSFSACMSRREAALKWDSEARCCLCLQPYAARGGRRALVPCAHLVCSRCAQDAIHGACPTCRASVAMHTKMEDHVE